MAELVALGFPDVALDGMALHGDATAAGEAARRAKGSVVALFAPAHGGAGGPGSDGGLSSLRDEVGAAAVAAAIRAASAAEAARTPIVVLRAGALPLLDPEREDHWMQRMLREGRSSSLQADVRAAVAEERADRERCLEALCRRIFVLLRERPDAQWLIETPSRVHEIGLPSEIAAVLDEFRGRRVGYWHDAANAARLDALGAADQEAWLELLGPHSVGITISDWSPLGERMPPGAGLVGWKSLRFQVRPRMLRVVTLDPTYPAPLLEDTLREVRGLGF